MNLFTLCASIALDKSDYERGLDDASRKTHSFGEKLKSGLATAAKAGAAGLAAATTAVTALSKAALDSYGDYEQLVGGVKTLFGTEAESVEEYAASVGKSVSEVQGEYDKLVRSQNTVMDNAANAFQTAGLSANEYMETVTSFSASLLQSLGGDTEAAARTADLAITDMADNANKMGTAMDSIQNAYQGFAKQNYTMLDNLKLGYGGTKEEMARLIEDAAKLKGLYGADAALYANKGVNGDLSIIIDAIHTIQTEIGITGTTALEASTTIQGSVSAAKSAWANLVAGIGNENSDLSSLITQFVDSVGIAGENIIPRVEQILVGIGNAVQKLSPIIQEQIPILVQNIAPPLIDAGAEFLSAIVSGMATAVVENAPAIWAAAISIVDELGNALGEHIPGLSSVFDNLETVVLSVTAAFVAFKAATAISKAIEAVTKATEGQTIAQAALNAVMNANPFVLVATLIAAVGTALVTLYMTNEDFRNKVNAAWQSIKSTISGVVNAVVTFFTVTVPNAGQEMLEFFKSIPDKALQWGKDLIDNFVNGIKSKVEDVKNAVSNVASTVKDFLGFSEPEKGPLSNFHTYAPDMMQLFAKGITDNAGLLKSAFDKSLNFGNPAVDFSANYASGGYIGNVSAPREQNAPQNSGAIGTPITIVVQSVLDGKVIGETSYNYIHNRERAYGGAY